MILEHRRSGSHRAVGSDDTGGECGDDNDSSGDGGVVKVVVVVVHRSR